MNRNGYRKRKTNQYTLEKQNETKLKRRTKTKRKEIRNCWKWENCLTADGWNSLMTPLNFICHQMASSFKDLLLDWLIKNNDDVMIPISDQKEEYYANLPISNGIRKNESYMWIFPSIDYHNHFISMVISIFIIYMYHHRHYYDCYCYSRLFYPNRAVFTYLITI